jgi:hypothetical protein
MTNVGYQVVPSGFVTWLGGLPALHQDHQGNPSEWYACMLVRVFFWLVCSTFYGFAFGSTQLIVLTITDNCLH